jgi:hypothetical protein
MRMIARRLRVGLFAAVLAACALAWAADPPPAPASEAERHPLELEALSDPKGALAKILPLIDSARAGSRHRELALLEIARANACRIFADWECQRDAGIAARQAADAAGEPLLAVRGLIAESRVRCSRNSNTARAARCSPRPSGAWSCTPSPALIGGRAAWLFVDEQPARPPRARSHLRRTAAWRRWVEMSEPLDPRATAAQPRPRRGPSRPAPMRSARHRCASRSRSLPCDGGSQAQRRAGPRARHASRATRAMSPPSAPAPQRVLELAMQFGHPQLRALGSEVLGQVARDRKELAAAEAAFQTKRPNSSGSPGSTPRSAACCAS